MRESVIYQEILAEGKAEGIRQAKQQVAVNLLREGMIIEQVAKVTEFSVEEIEALQVKMNSQSQGE